MDLDQSLILKCLHSIKRCLDANPLNRPTAKELDDILWSWHEDFDNQTELKEQIKEADEINNLSVNSNTTPTNLALS